MADIFTSISCTMLADNSRSISWSLDPGYDYPEDLLLQVEYSRNGGPWETIASGLSNQCVYFDKRVLNYNKYVNDCYRVRLSSKNSPDIDNLVSDICQAGRNEAYPYSAEAANAIAQIEKGMRLTGRPGVLLKKKQWGRRCPICTDFDGQGSVNEHCPQCLGTGIEGGYYPGISLSIQADAQQVGQQLTRNGTIEQDTIQGRCIAFPWIALGDVWCEDATNARYYIAQASVTAWYKHIPLVYQLVMHKLEFTDVLYRPEATAKVLGKDIWESASTDYTLELEEDTQEAEEDIQEVEEGSDDVYEALGDLPRWAQNLKK